MVGSLVIDETDSMDSDSLRKDPASMMSRHEMAGVQGLLALENAAEMDPNNTSINKVTEKNQLFYPSRMNLLYS